MRRNTFFLLVFSILFAIFLASCSSDSASSGQDDPITIVCTTGMIGDALEQVAADKAQVITLMGPGVDPHLYKATQGDLRRLSRADIIFYNGLHLEGKMGEVLERLSRTKAVVALAEGLPDSLFLNTTNYPDAYDPHIWFDLSIWSRAVRYAGSAMAEYFPQERAVWNKNAREYARRIDSLHQWVGKQIATIPEQQRVMITAHDAFGYFGAAYDIEVRGLQGISTVSEYGLKDISQLVSFITERGVKAVFVESSVPRKSLEAVVEGCAQRGHEVKIGGTLYSDAMGADGRPEGAYLGMVKHNVNTITNSLK